MDDVSDLCDRAGSRRSLCGDCVPRDCRKRKLLRLGLGDSLFFGEGFYWIKMLYEAKMFSRVF